MLRNLHFFDGIDTAELEAFSRAVANVESGDVITLDFCNGGGSVFHGIAICDMMTNARAKGAKFISNIWGYAASAACLVALSADEVYMSPNAALMYHSAWCPFDSDDPAIPLANSIQQTILSKRIARISSKDFNGEDHWVTASQALELGIIDNIIGNASSVEDSQDIRVAARFIWRTEMSKEPIKAEDVRKEEEAKAECSEKEEAKAECPVEEEKKNAPEAESGCGEENKDAPKAEDLDILEMIAKRLEDIEKRLSVLEGAGNKADEANPEPAPSASARRKALMQKLSAVCAPMPSVTVKPVAVAETPDEEAKRFKATYKNFDALMADFIKRK